MKRIAYLVSRYPSLSHTFIRREIHALRRKGFEIHTFAIRKPGDTRNLPEEDKEEHRNTYSILPARISTLIASHAKLMVACPGTWGKALLLAMGHRVPGVKGFVWSLFHFAEAGILASELKRRRIDRIHSHFSNAGGTVGLIASRILGIPWSFTLHGKADFFSETTMLLGNKIKNADFVACVSHFGKALSMLASKPSDWRKIIVVRCGIEMKALEGFTKRNKNGPLRILTVGRLAEEKGHLGLLHAMKILSEKYNSKYNSIELRIVGGGPLEKALRERIDEYGLKHMVKLLGPLPEEWRE